MQATALWMALMMKLKVAVKRRTMRKRNRKEKDLNEMKNLKKRAVEGENPYANLLPKALKKQTELKRHQRLSQAEQLLARH